MWRGRGGRACAGRVMARAAVRSQLRGGGLAARRRPASGLRKLPASTEVMFAGRFPAIRVERQAGRGARQRHRHHRDSIETLEAFLDAFEATTAGIETELIAVDLDSASESALEGLADMESDRLARRAHRRTAAARARLQFSRQRGDRQLPAVLRR